MRLLIGGEPIRLGSDQRVTIGVLAAAGAAGLTKAQLYEELFAHNPQKSREQTAVMRVQRLRDKVKSLAAETQIITTGHRFALDPQNCSVDLWDFDQTIVAAQGPALAQTLRTWAEPFEGLVDTPPSVLIAREQLRNRYQVALVRAGWNVQPGTDEDLIMRMIAELEDDPFNENLTASAAAAMYRVGRQPAALALIQDYRETLVDSYGLDAGHQVDNIEHAILNHRIEVLNRTPISEQRGAEPASEPPALLEPDRFVGRSEVLTELSQLVRNLTNPNQLQPGQMQLVQGDAGSGKTTLLGKIFGSPTQQGIRVRYGRGSSSHNELGGETVYGPFLQALPELFHELGQLSSSRDVEQGRILFWQSVHARLLELAETEPFALILEDMHDADSQSLALVRYLAGVTRPPELLLLLSGRPGEDLSGVWQPLVRDLAKAGSLAISDLGPLTVEDLRDLVRLDHPAEPPVVRERFAMRLRDLSNGNAYVASVVSRDSPPGLDTSMLSETLTSEEYLSRHLAAKASDPKLAQVLSVAALVGLEFDLDTLVDVCDVTAVELEALLRQAEEAALCTRVHDGRWRFDHLLTAAHFSARIDLLRPIMFARLASQQRASPNSMVRYIRGAGDQIDEHLARDKLLEAAIELEGQFAFGEAGVALDAALAYLPDRDASRLAAVLRRANCASRSGDTATALRCRSEAFELATELGDQESMYAAALAGLPAGEYAGGEVDRLEILEKIDPTQLRSVSVASFERWRLRMARICDKPEIASAVAGSIRANWADGDRDAWIALRLEALSFAAQEATAKPVLDDLAELADEIEPGSLRAEVLYRVTLAALREQQDQAGVISSFDAAAAEARVHGSARTKWSLDVLRATLSFVGMRPSQATPESARVSGLRWAIPDVFDTWGVQLWMQLWLTDQMPVGLKLIESNRDAIAGNVAWVAGEALGAITIGDTQRAQELCAEVCDEIERHPSGMWVPVAACLLTETAVELGDREFALFGEQTLQSRAGQAVVLGIGAAYFGPVDRYLGNAARLTRSNDGAELLGRARQQSEHSGATYWRDRIDRDLAMI